MLQIQEVKTILSRHFLCRVNMDYLTIRHENDNCIRILQSSKFFPACLNRSLLTPEEQGSRSILDINFPTQLWITTEVKEARRIAHHYTLLASHMPLDGKIFYILNN